VVRLRIVTVLCSVVKYHNSPESVSEEYRSGRHDTHGAVVLLCYKLQVVGVFPLPFGATILEPDLDLKIKLNTVKNTCVVGLVN
jgi:hypothetical protein